LSPVTAVAMALFSWLALRLTGHSHNSRKDV
jgi:hypothetical protein